MPRIHEVAKEVGVSSREVLDRLEAWGTPAKSHSSTIDEPTAARLRTELGNGSVDTQPEASTKAGAEPSTKAGTEPSTTVEAEDRPRPEPITKVEPKKRRWPFRRKQRPVRSRGARVLAQIAELPLLVLVAFLIAVVIKTFVMQAFYIPSGSMKPTLRVGDRVLVEKLSYLLGEPSQGDVIVFARSVLPNAERPDEPWTDDIRNYVRELLGLPTGTEEDYIKRVVAVSGDTIRYEGSPRRLFVNGERVSEPYLERPDNASTIITEGNCPGKMQAVEDSCQVPAGMVFVMGDNRDNSADSRSIGPIEEDKIIGRGFVVIWPFANFGGL
jgi:signal peptidase I